MRFSTAAHEAAGAAKGSGRRRALRLACLLELLYATGLRVSELVSLPRAALRGDRMMLTVKGKGGRERILPLNQKARDALDLYLAHEQLHAFRCPAPSRNGCFRPGARAGISRGRNSRAT